MSMGSPKVLHLCRLALCLLPVYLSACAAPGGQADAGQFDLAQESVERAELTTRLKAALVADERVAAASIQVLLDDDDALRLEGFVNDQAERDAALEIAREAAEGRSVTDALEVR